MTKNSTHKKIVDAAQKAKPAQVQSAIPKYMRDLLRMQDQAVATDMVLQQAELEFDIGDGKEVPRLEIECKDNDKAFSASQKILDTLETQLANTPRFIRSPDQEARTPFAKIDRFDQIKMLLLMLFLILMMLMGAANTYSNIMASGVVVFLEQPWLAWCISAMVPASSMVFKRFSDFFDYKTTKRRYAICIYVITSITIIAWMILFAQSFNGVAGEIDFTALGNSDGGKGALLVFLQTACEVLIAAALFLAIEDITMKYNPDVLKDNPVFHQMTGALKKHKAEHDALSQKRNKAHTAHTLLKNQRQQHVNNRASEFAALILSRSL